MIWEAHDRTRAILWLLADADPTLTIVEALGYLKAIEAQLEEARTRYSGPDGLRILLEDFQDRAPVRAAIRRREWGVVATVLQELSGCSYARAEQAAETMRHAF